MTEPSLPHFAFPTLDDMRRLLELANALHATVAPGRHGRLAAGLLRVLDADAAAIDLRTAADGPWTRLAAAPDADGPVTAAVDAGPDVPHDVTLLPGVDGRPPGVRSVLWQGEHLSVLSAWRRVPFEGRHVTLLTLLHPPSAWVFDHAVARHGLTEGAGVVLELMLAGLPEKEIAKRLGRSVHTIHTHIKRVYRHYDVNSRPELLVRLNHRGKGNAAHPQVNGV